MPSEEEILKALGLIQQTLEKHTQLFADQDTILHDIMQKVTKLDYHEQLLNAIGQDVGLIRTDVRMVRAAVNDMERTRFTSGEAEVIHEDINRLQVISTDLRARVKVLEERM